MLLRCFHPADHNKDFFARRSKPPPDRAHFDQATEFILGHLTSSVFLESIVSQGLIPDPYKERAKDANLPSDSKAVYLAVTYDSFFIDRAKEHHGGDGLIVEVRVSCSALAADECWVGDAEAAEIGSMEALYRSMCAGACKHMGVIGPEKILSIRDSKGVVHFQRG